MQHVGIIFQNRIETIVQLLATVVRKIAPANRLLRHRLDLYTHVLGINVCQINNYCPVGCVKVRIYSQFSQLPAVSNVAGTIGGLDVGGMLTTVAVAHEGSNQCPDFGKNWCAVVGHRDPRGH